MLQVRLECQDSLFGSIAAEYDLVILSSSALSTPMSLVIWHLMLSLAAHLITSIEAVTIETSWSNNATADGRAGMAAYVQASRDRTICPNGSFIHTWDVGIGNVKALPQSDADDGIRPSVVLLRAECSDGSRLRSLGSGTQPVVVHKYKENGKLRSATGYTCSQLLGYNIGWMVQFLGAGPKDPYASPLTLNCSAIPASYVAVGFAGIGGMAVDAIKVIMAPATASRSHQPLLDSTIDILPGEEKNTDDSSDGSQALEAAETAEPARHHNGGPAAVVAAGLQAQTDGEGPQSAGANRRPSSSPQKLSAAATVGVTATCLVGAALIAIVAYTLWKRKDKHTLAKDAATRNQGGLSGQ